MHKASNQARFYNYIANNGLTHSWIEYYRNPDIRSNQIYVNEWNQMDDILSHRSDSPHLYQLYVFNISKIEKFLRSYLSLDYHQMKKHFVLKYMSN